MGIVKATVQAATLSATSNILAQALKSYRADVSRNPPNHEQLHPLARLSTAKFPLTKPHSHQRPLSLDPTQIFQFIIFALLNTPPNFLWQAFLEDTFPAYAPTTSRSSAATDITTDTDTGISLTATVKRSPTGGSPQIVFEKTSEVPLNASGEVVPNKAGKKKLNIRNTAMKFALDQTVGALVNTVVFIAVMSAFRGVGRAQIMGMVRQVS